MSYTSDTIPPITTDGIEGQEPAKIDHVVDPGTPTSDADLGGDTVGDAALPPHAGQEDGLGEPIGRGRGVVVLVLVSRRPVAFTPITLAGAANYNNLLQLPLRPARASAGVANYNNLLQSPLRWWLT
jgi:hypothetical protein